MIELTCDICGYRGEDVEVFASPTSPWSNTYCPSCLGNGYEPWHELRTFVASGRLKLDNPVVAANIAILAKTCNHTFRSFWEKFTEEAQLLAKEWEKFPNGVL